MRSWVAVFVGFLAVALAAVGLVAVDAPTAPAADDPDGAIAVAADEGPGYWLVDETGVVYAFGRAQHHGDVSPGAGVTAVDLVSAPDGAGYWVLLSDGSVIARGSATDLVLADTVTPGVASVAIVATASGDGLWVFGADGSVSRYGQAPDLGGLTGVELNEEIIDAVAAGDGAGYYLLGRDGGVFAFGSADFHGSVPGVLPQGVDLNCPVVGIVLTSGGYWVVACDGGIFSFGDAPFRGSIPGVLPPGGQLVQPAEGMVEYGDGYLVVAGDGGVFNFSELEFLGGLGANPPGAPVVSVAVQADVPVGPPPDPTALFDACIPAPSQFDGRGISPLDCSAVVRWPAVVLPFDGSAGPSVNDRNGAATGFTMRLPATSSAEASGGLTAGSVNPAATAHTSTLRITGGRLEITAGPGTMAGGANNQQDALGIGLPLPNVPLAVSVTVVDPTTGTGAGEHSGLFFGISDRDHARLVVVSTPTGPEAHFVVEQADVSTVVGSTPITAGSLVLQLRIDPTAETVTAVAIRGDEETEIGSSAVPSSWFSKDAAGIDFTVGTRSYAGVIATSGNASQFVTTLDDFVIDTFETDGGGGEPPIPPVDEGVPVDFDFWTVTNVGFPSAIAVGPDDRVYVASALGQIHRLSINHNNRTVQRTTISTLGSRLALGIAIDPRSTPDNVSIWVQHSDASFNNGDANSGVVTRLSGNNLQNRQDVITGLPRAIANHGPNALHFGDDGKLYLAIGGNTGAGSSNDGASEFGPRPEQPLSAAILVADVFAPGFDGTCRSTQDPNGTTMDATGIAATDVPCDVEVYASGLRNTYDFTLHSNGHMYATDNGLGVEGTVPDLPPNDLAWDPGDPCVGPVNGAANRNAHNPGARVDLLIDVEDGAYYGHPNPSRGECVFYSGNPTGGVDGRIPQDSGTVGTDTNVYQVGTQAEPNFELPMFSLGRNKSANGIIEYTSHNFCGSLNGDLLVTYYSQDDQIRRVQLNNAGTAVTNTSQLGGTAAADLRNPLPIAQDRFGRLYVGEFLANRVRVFEPDADACWEQASPGELPVRLLDAGSAVVGDRIYAVGGKTPGGVHQRTLWIYDTVSHTWSRGADLPAAYPAVENPAVVAHDGRIYAFGGSTAPFSGAVPNAAVYNPATDSWTMLASMTTGRGGPGAAVMGDEVYVVGGLSATGQSLATVEKFDLDAGTWSNGPTLATPRDNPMVGAADGVVVVAGGRTRNVPGQPFNANLDSVERLVGGNWQSAADMPTGRRAGNAVAVGDRIIFLGGERTASGGTFDAVERYDPSSNSWTALDDMPVGRHGAIAGLVDGIIYVMGGGTNGGSSFTSDGAAYHLN